MTSGLIDIFSKIRSLGNKIIEMKNNDNVIMLIIIMLIKTIFADTT